MQYGFVIDHDNCIGCHACTVACKSENDVPVGNFRTSVKYVEEGTYPAIKRHFLVQRCNHCTDAPCVTICPVNALEKRDDGIVDIDRDACIGCRACMQACPYDAIYLNEDKGAVEKCHFCAHRVEQNLEPACAVVCPTNAIIAGDLDDPGSKVSLLVQNNPTQVRRPEQGTSPNVHYKGAAAIAMQPGRAARPDTYLFSQRQDTKPEPWPASVPTVPDAQVVLDVGHKVEWGWPVSLYLLTKSIAAGAAMLAPFIGAFGFTGWRANWLPELLALVFTLVTLLLLVEDLARPMRFYRLLTRPNWKSWLVKGGVILGAFCALTVGILVLRLAGADGLADGLRWPNAVLGLFAAAYTAFLFAQCKGRDLWEGRLLLPHLVVSALLMGSAAFLIAAPAGTTALAILLLSLVLVHLGLAFAERYGSHPTENARQGAAFLGTVGLFGSPAFLDGVILSVAGFICVLIGFTYAGPIALLLGLYCYEHAYVRAGQLPPLS
ncbi:MAG: polysulfide reductase NrfD [Phycisphaerales bacterium]|nr:polysulfide reductase NrfD [Phycisphaerales bacterium]